MKVRLAHISDLHIQDGPRAQEIASVLEAAGEEFRRAAVDLILCTGDVFDSLSSPAERAVVKRVFRLWAEIAPVVVIKGNHDRPEDLALFDEADLRGGYPIRVFERAGSIGGSEWVVFSLPWFDKAFIASQVSMEDEDADSLGQRIQQAARSVLAGIRSLALEQAGDRIPILGAHVLVGGAQVSTGQTLIGTTIEIPPHDLADAGCAYVALGHVHKTQAWADGRVAYAGSPWRQNFGEPEEKGFRLVEIEQAGGLGLTTVRNDFVALPARRIELVEVDLTSASARRKFMEDPLSLIGEQLKDCNDSLVRVRYSIDPSHLSSVDPEALEQTVRNLGAFHVKAEAIQVQSARARAPEIAAADSLVEKMNAYFRAKNIAVDEGQLARLSAKLDAFGGPA